MKKVLLIAMLVVVSALSFASRGDKGEGDFYSLYNEAYTAVETPGMHKDVNMKADEVDKVKNIINKGWYEIKILEVDKLKHVFAIDKLLVDGPGNKEKIDEHIAEIHKLNDEMEKVYNDTRNELKKHIDVDKLK